MIQLYYWRKHLPTDTVYIDTFNGTQVPDLQFMSFALAERECKAAVVKWNRMGGDTWLYDYIGVRNEEVLKYEQENACSI